MILFWVIMALVTAGACGLVAMVGIVAIGVHREERNFSLLDDGRGPLVRSARKLTGVYTRGLDWDRAIGSRPVRSSGGSPGRRPEPVREAREQSGDAIRPIGAGPDPRTGSLATVGQGSRSEVRSAPLINESGEARSLAPNGWRTRAARGRRSALKRSA